MNNIFYFQWHITDFCGNRCSHCYIDNFGKTNVSLEAALSIIKDMKECCDEMEVTPEIAITGGDSLLHPHIWEILTEARKISGRLIILGNPELLNESTIKKLIDIGIDNYQVSIDGMENVHDQIRSPGSFKRTSDAIKRMLQSGLRVSVMTTVSSINQSQIVDVIKYVYSLGVKKWSFARYTPDTGDCGISAEEYSVFLKQLIKEHEPFTQRGIPIPTKEPLVSIVASQSTDLNRVIGGCGLGSSMLSILPDNTVMGCRRHRDSTLGKWKEPGDLLNFFLFHPKMDKYRNIKKIKGCNKCELINQCRGCRAAAFAASGDTFGKDPQCFLGIT